MRRAAEGVARKLVGQDQQRQRAVRRLDPVVVSARGDGHMQVEKAVMECGVEDRVLFEPAVGGRPPERHDIVGRAVAVRIGAPAA